jgi:hypothetical protein
MSEDVIRLLVEIRAALDSQAQALLSIARTMSGARFVVEPLYPDEQKVLDSIIEKMSKVPPGGLVQLDAEQFKLWIEKLKPGITYF